MDYFADLTETEMLWIEAHPKIKTDLIKEADDITNVNPLEDGSPDLRSFNIFVKALKLLIEISKKDLVKGPYNEDHYLIIHHYFPFEELSTAKFWNLFSAYCASKKKEGRFTAERLYISAICELEILSSIEKADLSTLELGGTVFDFNLGRALSVQGVGVSARFG